MLTKQETLLGKYARAESSRRAVAWLLGCLWPITLTPGLSWRCTHRISQGGSQREGSWGIGGISELESLSVLLSC